MVAAADTLAYIGALAAFSSARCSLSCSGKSTRAGGSDARSGCTLAGFSSDGAELLRLGENAIYRMASVPIVVRIARSADRLARVEKELCVARWLAAAEVPGSRAGRPSRHRNTFCVSVRDVGTSP